ncbi:MAG: SDR family oxidoreductase [Rudaea sp.]|uniref:SDR family oxidoreductase n=1 Tax=unclassified Rudaea TaxID=2627037 RepID=UPI0010F63EEF|nr:MULTISPECIES: SDR family oxidoreductase [unclassified Rudaea]MBN8887992.1 SDR family oxidoreductase [Rudaea sp.]MBR0345645.1 SDR family oxidoreductase [Rudaea sp.]
MNLQGKKIAVTGAAGSLGAAIVHAALDAGAVVAAVDHAPVAAVDSKNLHEFGGVDLASDEAAQKAFATIDEKLGGLDALVNVAGTFRWEKVEHGRLATWDLLFNVNLRTAVASSMAALPLLAQSKAGRIVNIGAAGATKAAAGMGAYAASKAGVAKLTEALAEELKDRGVTVNAILPTTIDTPVNRKDMPDADHSRWVKPEQIAAVILFLLSDEAQAVTGALIPVAGRT